MHSRHAPGTASVQAATAKAPRSADDLGGDEPGLRRCAHKDGGGSHLRRSPDGGLPAGAAGPRPHRPDGRLPTARPAGHPRDRLFDPQRLPAEALRNQQQLDFAYAIPGVARFRVNTFFQRGAITAAFRHIPDEIQSMDSLGLPPVMEEFTRKPRGFVLVTGPTGSGKSTTLASMVDSINAEREEHILTIEDPIEFLHSHRKCIVNQREIGADAADFSVALKAALREDPDVILVGEMRDLETISTALTAAETGHLVFATLHTQSTAQTVDRIIDVFPPHQQHQVRMQLSIALQGIVTQQLLPTADGSSRVVACEIMVPTPAVRNLIREGKTHQIYSALQTSGAVGMQTMDSHLAQLVRGGKINRALAEQRASVPEELKRLLAGVGGMTRVPAAA